MAAATISLAPPARAQIGNIFSDPAPRPPGAIPRGGREQPLIDDDEEQVPELPRGRLLPTPNRPPPGQGVPPPGSVQTQPLAPPPGTTVIPQNTAPGIAVAPPRVAPQPGVPPGGRQPKGAPRARHAGDAAARRRGGVRAAGQKIVNKKASFSGLDKITGRIINFDEDIGETVQFGALRVKTNACYTRPATEAANTDAFVEVDEITLQGEVKRIFSGWMYAASPGLHGVEHPIYDIWLTDCKVPDTTIVTAAARRRRRSPRRPRKSVRRRRSRRFHARRRRRSRNSSSNRRRQPPPQQQQPGGLFGIFRSPKAPRSAALRDDLQRFRAADGMIDRQSRKIRRGALDRLVEQHGIAPPRESRPRRSCANAR